MKKIHTLAAFLSAFLLHGYHAHADSVSLGNTVTVAQVPNQSGAVLISGNFTKPVTSGDVTLTIKYKDAANNWVSVWCKAFPAGDQYDEQLKAAFELPASTLSAYDIKMELSAGATLNNWPSITWQSAVNHYKQGDYTAGICDLDENQYTILFTPRKSGTVQYTNGNVSGVKDRVNSSHLYKKLNNIVLSVNGNGVIDSTVSNAPYINLSNPNGVSEIVSSQKYIYQGSDASPFEFSYHDPVFLFAGKFPNTGFFINFSNWYLPASEGGEGWGRGYLDFTNPNSLLNRYYNLYNYIEEKLPDVIANQEPVVIAISKITGFRIYKADGSYVSLHAINNYGYHNTFGYPKLWEKFRGPGSENFSLKGVSAASLYGVGAIRNHIVNGQPRPLTEVESEIKKFINYVGIFGDTSSYAAAEACTNACVAVKPGAQPDFTPTDWTLAPNSYIFTGKDKNGGNTDGFYIPVAKAYAMWENGGEFMKNTQGSYTPIPAGTETAGLYWEDENGLIKNVSLEGAGKTAKIKVMVNKLKEGNAAISYRVNDTIYWTWHVWVTDDPANGSAYHLGFEKDKNGNLVTDWKWMDRNLGATNADFTGHGWNKSGGLQYQWGRKDPFPTFAHKDGDAYELAGEVGALTALPLKFRGNVMSDTLNNTKSDAPAGNIQFSIRNPLAMIVPPMYVYKLGETPNTNGENFFLERLDAQGNKYWARNESTNWFSKQRYKVYDSANHYNTVAWDLWGDTRGGKWSNVNTNDSVVKEESKRYNMKSPYDPCPCNWRVPSFYANVGVDHNSSPWGKGGSNTQNNVQIKPDTLSTVYPGIKVYPGLGFDFREVTGRNLGRIPVNGNYEYYPNEVSLGNPLNYVVDGNKLYQKISMNFQDSHSDGSLRSSTFFIASPPSSTGVRSLTFVSDAGNPKTSIGWFNMAHNFTVNTHETGGIRCIKDPNNAYMPAAFETESIPASAEEYTTEELMSWTKEPNSYIEYADSTLATPRPEDKDRIVKIPLKKAYAMYKLYLSEDGSFPAGSIKSASVVWTTDAGLVNNMEIMPGTSMLTDTLKVTLNPGKAGNAVVAFHLGNSGGWSNGNPVDPVLWSWHLWVPKTVVNEQDTFVTETTQNGGILPANDQFVNPTPTYGVPLETIVMDRDLGAQKALPNNTGLVGADMSSWFFPWLTEVKDAGGLHYQWGRKDPIPVFRNPGGSYHFNTAFNTYAVYRQTGVNNNAPVYSAAINNAGYTAGYTQEYGTYAANLGSAPTQEDKVKRILKYSVNNPMVYLYRNAETIPNTNPVQYKVKDWLSDKNGLMQDRWGHAKEKSPFDPCPAGWRMPDLQGVAMSGFNISGKYAYLALASGNNPWFYNPDFKETINNKVITYYGIDPSWINGMVENTSYNINKKVYQGGFIRAFGSGGFPTVRYGFIFNNPAYNIGNFPNMGIRGMYGGNSFAATMSNAGSTDATAVFGRSGVWTAAPLGDQSGNAIGMLFNTEISWNASFPNEKLFFFRPTQEFSPQAAMSCRCAKIFYDDNGKEKGRYDPDTMQVPQDALQRPSDTFEPEKIAGMLKKQSITVFPNPVTNVVYIDAVAGKEYYYQVYNMAGQLVKEGKFVNKQADFSTLQAGAYLIRINNSESVVKIVKL